MDALLLEDDFMTHIFLLTMEAGLFGTFAQRMRLTMLLTEPPYTLIHLKLG